MLTYMSNKFISNKCYHLVQNTNFIKMGKINKIGEIFWQYKQFIWGHVKIGKHVKLTTPVTGWQFLLRIALSDVPGVKNWCRMTGTPTHADIADTSREVHVLFRSINLIHSFPWCIWYKVIIYRIIWNLSNLLNIHVCLL